MIRNIRALLFDFDGLILDTETTEMGVWKRIYAEYGLLYPEERWAENVGFWGDHHYFDSAGHLRELSSSPLDADALRKRHHDESAILLQAQAPRPGVENYLASARRLGLRLAVASGSPRHWVQMHLTRMGLISRFDRIVTADDVPAGRSKPNPDIYLKALELLGVAAHEAIALEDSPPGVAAAHAAGIFTVAVPNPVTVRLKLEHADMVLNDLSALPLEQLIQRAIT